MHFQRSNWVSRSQFMNSVARPSFHLERGAWRGSRSSGADGLAGGGGAGPVGPNLARAAGGAGTASTGKTTGVTGIGTTFHMDTFTVKAGGSNIPMRIGEVPPAAGVMALSS